MDQSETAKETSSTEERTSEARVQKRCSREAEIHKKEEDELLVHYVENVSEAIFKLFEKQPQPRESNVDRAKKLAISKEELKVTTSSIEELKFMMVSYFMKESNKTN